MNILFIGVADKEIIIPMLQAAIDKPLTVYDTEDIAEASALIEACDIDIFFCDLKFPEQQVWDWIHTNDGYDKITIRGALIGNHVNNDLAIKGINSYIIRDYILRPYDSQRIAQMWHLCIGDILYVHHLPFP